MTAKIRALVFGASGYIGTNLTPRLIDAGWQVRAAARHRAVLEARNWDGADLVEADALDPDTLPAALQDIEIAFYLVHSMAAGSDFARLDAEAARNFAAAAEAAGVKRIVYLGGLIPDDPRSLHLKSRAETGDVLRHAQPSDDIWRQHADILDAIVNGEPDIAETRAVDHIRLAADRLSKTLSADAAPDRMG